MGLLPIADAVIVDDEHRAAESRGQNGVELAAKLGWLLGARAPVEQLNDVAELAGERAAAAPLHADRMVGTDVEQVVAWWRHELEMGPLDGHEARGQGHVV